MGLPEDPGPSFASMRVLITTTGSDGHFGPLIPFAAAIRAAGDSVIAAVAADVRALPTVDVAAELLRELAAQRV